MVDRFGLLNFPLQHCRRMPAPAGGTNVRKNARYAGVKCDPLHRWGVGGGVTAPYSLPNMATEINNYIQIRREVGYYSQ